MLIPDIVPSFPLYDLELLIRVARADLIAAGQEPDDLSIYRRVARLRREQLGAAARQRSWPDRQERLP